MPAARPAVAAPFAEGTGLPWDVSVGDAVAAIAAARARCGDTFVVTSGRDHHLFNFSPTGVESFYALAEEKASKGIADYLMLLPLLNTSAAPGLTHWDTDRWTPHRLKQQHTLPSPAMVTAYGHGRHSCPARPFSLAAMTAA